MGIIIIEEHASSPVLLRRPTAPDLLQTLGVLTWGREKVHYCHITLVVFVLFTSLVDKIIETIVVAFSLQVIFLLCFVKCTHEA